MPGFVCAHHHLYQGASRGIAAHGGLLEWLALHYRAWARMSERDVEVAATLSAAQLALGGCTTVAAFEYLHPAGVDFVTPVVRAAERVGLRLLYVRGSAPRLEGSLSARLAAEGVDLDRLVEPEERALAGTADVLARPATDRLRWAAGPTTPVLDDEGAFQRALTELADRHDVGLHTHFHPLEGTQRSGESAAEAARRLGLVRRGNWFAHGSRLSDVDVAELGADGVGVVHAPSCSVLLGYPIPDLAAWSSSSERIAVAVDGSASNDRGSSLLEAQLAWQLQRATASGGRASPSEAEILALATEGGARTIGWDELGRLDVGVPADIAVIELDGLEHAGIPGMAEADPATLLMRTYAGGHVRHLLVGDRVVIEDGELRGVDAAAVRTDANVVATRLYG
jgi:cytosine/adenosine deaminase-related metal-dependent hydrolase